MDSSCRISYIRGSARKPGTIELLLGPKFNTCVENNSIPAEGFLELTLIAPLGYNHQPLLLRGFP